MQIEFHLVHEFHLVQVEFHLVQIDMEIVYSYLYQIELQVLNSM